MAKIPMRLSAKEILDILDQQWLDTKDIKNIACVGIKNAKKIKEEITKRIKLEDENYFLPNGLLPTDKVIEYLNLNINYLKKIAERKWWKMTETQMMFEIIHENQKRVRAFNIKRAKKQKKQAVIDDIVMFLASSTFLIGIMTFIAVIESMKF